MSSTDLARSADAVCANLAQNAARSGPSPSLPSARSRTRSTTAASSRTANPAFTCRAASTGTAAAALSGHGPPAVTYGRYTGTRTSSSRTASRNAQGA
ncbi:hypothetical protein GCM10010353_25330 [Streptomyces chryseus]|nr:hypothetical protein GCM10010353_25330 [Streptomyces chryseus]